MCVCVWVHACIHVCACLCARVCPFSMCVYVYVRDYSHVLLLTSNVGIQAFACTPIGQLRYDSRCNKLEVRKKVSDIRIYIHTDARTHMHL